MTVTLATGDVVFEKVNFWAEFLKEQTMRNKLEHYRYIRAKVKLHFFFNVTPRFYTKLLLAVNWIVPTNSDSLDSGFDDWSTSAVDGPVDNILASQSLCTYVSTEVSKSELIVPFVYRAEYIDMIDATPHFGSTANAHLKGEAGTLHVRSMCPLRYAGEPPISATCDLTVMMSLEDVELRGTTSKALVLPASSVVHRINGISDKILVYGTVAANVAKAIGELASVLGFSRVNIGHEPGIYRERAVGNTALTDVPTISAKLTVHKDQALFVGYDPLKEGGVGDIETLASIASRPSYLTNFVWQTSQSPGTHLFSIRVSPYMMAIQDGALRLTSSCFAAFPFSYWSGTVTIKFEAVASFLHRGRLLFVYDSGSSGGYSFIQNRCVVLDITGDHAVSISVTPNGPTTFLPAPDVNDPPNHQTSKYGEDVDWACGTISVYVMNRLSAPEATLGTPINMLVYTHMEDDAQFAVPSARIGGLALVEPASAITTNETSVIINNDFSFADDTYGMYFGEHIVSIRSLLQRFSLNMVFYPELSSSTVGTPYFVNIMMPMQGIHRGHVGDRNPGVSMVDFKPNTLAGAPYNRAYTTPLQYWSSAYIGMKGSIRWKFMARGTHAAVPGRGYQVGGYFITEYPDAYAAYGSINSLTTLDALFGEEMEMGFRGAQYESTDSPVEIEVPYYCNHKFTLCRTTRDDTKLPVASYTGTGFTQSGISYIAVHTAVGDDFSLLGYIGPPKLYTVGLLGTR
jgi:hypothetical protein